MDFFDLKRPFFPRTFISHFPLVIFFNEFKNARLTIIVRTVFDPRNISLDNFIYMVTLASLSASGTKP